MEKYKRESFDLRKESEQKKFEELSDEDRGLLIERAHEEASKINEKIESGEADTIEQALGLVKKEKVRAILDQNPSLEGVLESVPKPDGAGWPAKLYSETSELIDLAEDKDARFIAFLRKDEEKGSETGEQAIQNARYLPYHYNYRGFMTYGVFDKEQQKVIGHGRDQFYDSLSKDYRVIQEDIGGYGAIAIAGKGQQVEINEYSHPFMGGSRKIKETSDVVTVLCFPRTKKEAVKREFRVSPPLHERLDK